MAKQSTENVERLREIENQMDRAGVSDLFGTKKEVKALPTILDVEETIIYATSGIVGTGTVLVVVTDKRLLFVDRGLIYGTNFREIPFSKINAVNYSTRLLLADISIDNGANTTKIDNVNKKTAPIFVDKLKGAIASFQDNANSPVNASSSNSLADELTKLSGLKDAGILTEDEFNQQKAKLLNN
ncbi:hypothetical protein ESZ50_02900 [Weissella muntiaci]|uniref:YokE-like PH domain-containing protein n=1 Tax=Weissella muntiaci TaxID=2508881 RepID=A0A6C2C8U6_9LACO|nr:PH domain-containing protein [Weissella muntiaci]TYC50026.1 hypothetical protein ESZ50_02900 [Weissella muntiaci]